MDMPNIQPLLRKAAKKSFLIRALAFTLVIVFAVLIGYIAGRISSRECSKSVLGSQWPTFPSPTPTPTSHWPTFPSPTPTPTSHWPTFPSPTPTPQPSHWPTFPSPTPTPQPSHWPTFPSPTPTPQPSHWPTPSPNAWPSPSPAKTPLNADQMKKIISNAGITVTGQEIPASASAHTIVIHGAEMNKLFGLIPISYPVLVSIDRISGLIQNISRPWWTIILNPQLTSEKCENINTKNQCNSTSGCRYYGTCGKCGDANNPPDPSCKCSADVFTNQCNNTGDCQWYSECVGGVCGDKGLNSYQACGGCENINTKNQCNSTSGCQYINNKCQ